MATIVVKAKVGVEYDVYIGRAVPRRGLEASPFANPFKIGRDGTRKDVLDKFTAYLLANKPLLARVPELRGKVLGCWCAPPGGLTADDPVICHGQILAALADSAADRPDPRGREEDDNGLS